MELNIQSWLTIVVDAVAAVMFLKISTRFSSSFLLGVAWIFAAAGALMAIGARYESPAITAISYASGFITSIAGYLFLLKARYFKSRQ